MSPCSNGEMAREKAAHQSGAKGGWSTHPAYIAVVLRLWLRDGHAAPASLDGLSGLEFSGTAPMAAYHWAAPFTALHPVFPSQREGLQEETADPARHRFACPPRHCYPASRLALCCHQLAGGGGKGREGQQGMARQRRACDWGAALGQPGESHRALHPLPVKGELRKLTRPMLPRKAPSSVYLLGTCLAAPRHWAPGSLSSLLSGHPGCKGARHAGRPVAN